ncbi:MAG TPA: NAD-dependent epimerase/dehydratase family protein [Polyangiaceae bacterium]|nr:NAD-dependent epimerase/dehydratase family protein [Polyangiaceae bacterium]
MKVLYIGGTGEISHACVLESLTLGHDVTVLNRSQTKQTLPARVRQLSGDLQSDTTYASLGDEKFDSVCQFFAFEPARIERDIAAFAGRTGQYLFISTASAYFKPIDRFERITERTPLGNPFWEYSQKKARMEATLFDAHAQGRLPVTVVRPSHTYRRRLPSALGGGDWTARRMLAGQRVIVHGDGTSLWTLTHASDFARPFARLLGNGRALGEAFHITGENVHTWDEIFTEMGRALGVEPRLVHIASDTLVRYEPAWKGPLHGDKAPSTVFDNSKVSSVAGPFPTTVAPREGFAAAAPEVLERLDRGVGVDPALDAKVDRILHDLDARG